MTPEHVELTQALIVLVVEWRERAARNQRWDSGPEHAASNTLDECANELEAALKAQAKISA